MSELYGAANACTIHMMMMVIQLYTTSTCHGYIQQIYTTYTHIHNPDIHMTITYE